MKKFLLGTLLVLITAAGVYIAIKRAQVPLGPVISDGSKEVKTALAWIKAGDDNDLYALKELLSKPENANMADIFLKDRALLGKATKRALVGKATIEQPGGVKIREISFAEDAVNIKNKKPVRLRIFVEEDASKKFKVAACRYTAGKTAVQGDQLTGKSVFPQAASKDNSPLDAAGEWFAKLGKEDKAYCGKFRAADVALSLGKMPPEYKLLPDDPQGANYLKQRFTDNNTKNHFLGHKISDENLTLSGFEYAFADYCEENDTQYRILTLFLCRDAYWPEKSEWMPFDIAVRGWRKKNPKQDFGKILEGMKKKYQ